MGFLIVFIAIIIVIILIFSSPKLSPIPYYPTNKHDLPLIIKALKLKNNQTVVDLGAGDGFVIFTAAKEAYERKLKTRFVAIEINPVLILIMNIKRFFHPNRKNIKIIHGNMFKPDFMNFINFKNFITVYLYISPWFIERVIENWKLKIENFSVVSYMYPVKSLKKKEKIIRGKNSIFVYNF